MVEHASLMNGIVFDIRRFSIHDGPGIRTTVFLKGCPLRCFWCHNPEGLRPKPEIQFFSSRCIGCGECVRACPEGAQGLSAEDGRVFNRELCVVCGQCVETCYPGGLQITGQAMTVEEVVLEVLKDRTFYETSNGGVTLSGGEPLLQAEFSLALLRRCLEEGLHTAVETTGFARWETLAEFLPLTDLFLMDLKHMDEAKHRQATGVSNERILANARQLAQSGKPVLFRVPVVPGVNDTPAEIAAIAQFVQELAAQAEPGRIELELLPFHRMATDKYTSLGMDYRARELQTPPKEQMAALAEAARQVGVAVRGH
jgi:pyruvate formate lyase activating enzyme